MVSLSNHRGALRQAQGERNNFALEQEFKDSVDQLEGHRVYSDGHVITNNG